MRVYAIIFIFLITLSMSVLSHASEPINEVHAMFYYQVPLGAKKTQQAQHSFGFRMDRASHRLGQLIQYQQLFNKPAVLDLRFNRHGAESLNVSGVDYLKLYRLHRASEAGAEQEVADTPEGETEQTEEKPNPVAKMAKDIGGVIKDAPAGVLLGIGMAIVLVSGVGG